MMQTQKNRPADAHTQTHARADITCALECVRTRTYLYAHLSSPAPALAPAPACTFARAHRQTHTYMQSHAHAHAHTHTHTHTHTRTQMGMRMRTRTRVRTHEYSRRSGAFAFRTSYCRSCRSSDSTGLLSFDHGARGRHGLIHEAVSLMATALFRSAS